MRWLNARLKSFSHAGRGLRVLLGQSNARIHLIVALSVIVFAAILRISAGDWAILSLCIALVIALEAVNTAIERVVDLASPEWHALARDAKDLAAGAVLIGAIGAAVAGAIILAPYVFW
jgi:diacylglycerol kinase